MKNFFSFFLFIIPLALTAQEKFSITGSVEGLPAGSVVTLSDVNNPQDTLAKSTISSGSFTLNGRIEEPNLVQLNFDGVKRKAVLFIGNENIRIKGKIDTVLDVLVTGSRVHDDFEQFKNIFNPLFENLSALGQRLNSSKAVTRGDSLTTAYMVQLEKIKQEVDRFVRNNPSSPVSPFVLVVTAELEQDISKTEKRFALLDKKMQSGFYGSIIRQQIDNGKVGAIGSQAIEFSQQDTEGKTVSLSSFRGKYVLIDFWASWCGPCRQENPNVVNAYNKFRNKNFTVLGISLDRDRNAWLNAIKEDKLTWTQLSDLKFWNNEVAAKYKIQSIPQNFLIDPDGKIIGKNLRGPELEMTLARTLK